MDKFIARIRHIKLYGRTYVKLLDAVIDFMKKLFFFPSNTYVRRAIATIPKRIPVDLIYYYTTETKFELRHELQPPSFP